MRRTTLDKSRTPAIVADELKYWDQCATRHHELGTEGYKVFLAEGKNQLELEACHDLNPCNMLVDEELRPVNKNTRPFRVIRRLVALLLQERAMLEMNEAQLKAIGFDSAFIALGRW